MSGGTGLENQREEGRDWERECGEDPVGSCVAGCCGSGATVLLRPPAVDFRGCRAAYLRERTNPVPVAKEKGTVERRGVGCASTGGSLDPHPRARNLLRVAASAVLVALANGRERLHSYGEGDRGKSCGVKEKVL